MVELRAGRGAGAGQAAVAVVQAAGIVAVGAALLQHTRSGHINTLKIMIKDQEKLEKEERKLR